MSVRITRINKVSSVRYPMSNFSMSDPLLFVLSFVQCPVSNPLSNVQCPILCPISNVKSFVQCQICQCPILCPMYNIQRLKLQVRVGYSATLLSIQLLKLLVKKTNKTRRKNLSVKTFFGSRDQVCVTFSVFYI